MMYDVFLYTITSENMVSTSWVRMKFEFWFVILVSSTTSDVLIVGVVVSSYLTSSLAHSLP